MRRCVMAIVAIAMLATMCSASNAAPKVGKRPGMARASDLPPCPGVTLRTTYGCEDPKDGGFTDRGDGTETLYIRRDGVRSEVDMPWGSLSSGLIPPEAQPTHGGTAPSHYSPPRLVFGTSDEPIHSGLTLKSTTCKTIDETYVWDFVCYYRYKYTTEEDPNKNYNTVWSVGFSEGQGAQDADCVWNYNERCLERVRNKFTINEKSNWCTYDGAGCSVDTYVSPGTCCTKTGDGTTKTASISLQFGGVGASISSTYTTYIDKFGMENLKWSVHSHDWWSIDALYGRGKPTIIGRDGGAEYWWKPSKGSRPGCTYYANAWDNYGFMYIG